MECYHVFKFYWYGFFFSHIYILKYIINTLHVFYNYVALKIMFNSVVQINGRMLIWI